MHKLHVENQIYFVQYNSFRLAFGIARLFAVHIHTILSDSNWSFLQKIAYADLTAPHRPLSSKDVTNITQKTAGTILNSFGRVQTDEGSRIANL